MGDRISADLRFAARLLARNPGFTLVAIVTLALGIGANTAIFTVANAILLRPLPYLHPDRLVLLSLSNPKEAVIAGVFSYPRFKFLNEHSKSFSGLAAFTNESFNLTDTSDPEQLPAARVSAGFFRVMGVYPQLGRDFLPEEDQPGGKPVVLISHGMWVRRYGASPAVVGRTINLNTQAFTIIGVIPPGFRFGFIGSSVDIWAPRVFELNLATPQQIAAGAGFLNAVARLAPGVSIEQAKAEMDVVNRQYQRENAGMGDASPQNTVTVADLREQIVANIRPAVLLLFAAVGLVLLIACANVASLLLSRTLGRRKEIAIRTALGAGRATLVRQLLTESVLLSFLGGALGVLLSYGATRALASLAAQKLPRAGEIQTDTVVLVFAAALSILTGIVFGMMPAIEASRPDLNTGLRDESRGSTGGRGRHRLRAGLVAVQVALSVILLIGSGLLIRSFVQLLNVSPGVDASNVLTMNIPLPPARYQLSRQMTTFFDEVVVRAQQLPGVRSAAVASALPLNATRYSPAWMEGQPEVPMPQRPIMVIEMVSPTYFATMRTPLLAGRFFTAHDDPDAPLVAIVNQALARRYWPNTKAVGKRIYLGRLTAPMEVVGVTADIKNITLAADAAAAIYLPYAQRPWRSMNLILRTNADPHTLIAAARHLVASVDKDQPVTAVQTLEELLADSRTQPRLLMLLLAVFSATAFLLAVVGIYGTLSYLVAQRTQELGIRIALGASRRDIIAMVVRQGMAITVAGLVIGLSFSLYLTRLLSSLLFHVSDTDPLTFVAAALVFSFVALVASYVPARRATHVDPTLAMR